MSSVNSYYNRTHPNSISRAAIHHYVDGLEARHQANANNATVRAFRAGGTDSDLSQLFDRNEALEVTARQFFTNPEARAALLEAYERKIGIAIGTFPRNIPYEPQVPEPFIGHGLQNYPAHQGDQLQPDTLINR